MNQRLVELETVRRVAGVGLDVRSPAGPGAAPPGYYMLFVFDAQGTPSIARWVRVERGRARAGDAAGRRARADRDAHRATGRRPRRSRRPTPTPTSAAPRADRTAPRATARSPAAAAASRPAQALRGGPRRARRPRSAGRRVKRTLTFTRADAHAHGRRHARRAAPRASSVRPRPRRAPATARTVDAPLARVSGAVASRRARRGDRGGRQRHAREDRRRRVGDHPARALAVDDGDARPRSDARRPPARCRSPAITCAWPSAISRVREPPARARRRSTERAVSCTSTSPSTSRTSRAGSRWKDGLRSGCASRIRNPRTRIRNSSSSKIPGSSP